MKKKIINRSLICFFCTILFMVITIGVTLTGCGKEKVVKTTAKGVKVKTNFLNIKKWFYEKFPDQDPNKKVR